MLIILSNKRSEKSFNFLSHNSKLSGNQNLRDTLRNGYVFNYLAQDNKINHIYKYCGVSKRLNVAGCWSFSAKWGKIK